MIEGRRKGSQLHEDSFYKLGEGGKKYFRNS